MITGNCIKRAFHGFLCFLIAFNQIFPTYAQIAVDGAAPASNQADLTNAPNGVPIVNIVTPNGNGVSHNKFSDYNVGANGLILNNSKTFGASQLGGVIIGNPNLTGAEANKIINEVTSANPTLLEGATEVFGSSADVIVANPNGVTCNGCGFINTPKSTLTTGVPELNGAGALTNISVNRGTITIGGTGLDVNGGNKAELFARAVSLNSDIQAGEIEIVTGRNDIDPNTNAAIAKADDASTKPAFALDTAALGGMYANRITLKGTENGVGFRLLGDVAASAGDLIITNDGRIAAKNLASTNDITITTTASDIDLDGAVTSDGTTRLISANDINLSADTTIESGGANTILTAAGTITNDESAIIAYQDLTINAANLVNDKAYIVSKDNLTIQGEVDATNMTTLDNLGGTIESIAGDVLINADTVNNISDVQTESTTTNYRYFWSSDSLPSYIPHGQDLSPEAWAYMPNRGNHVMAINPYLIESVLAAEGRTLSEFETSPNLYSFTVADWQSLAPTTNAEWRDIIGLRSSPTSGLLERDKEWSVLVAGSGVSSGWYTVQVVEDSIRDGTTPQIAGISSQAGDLTINAIDINNDKGFLSAANDITLNGTNLNLTAADLSRRVVQRAGGSTHSRETGWGTWLTHTSAVTRYSDDIGSVPATIAAGGNVNGTLSGSVTATTTPVSDLNDFSFGSTSHGVLRAAVQTGNMQSPVFTNSGLIRPASDSNFLYETRFEYTNLGTFFGSDYFLNGVLGAGFDPDTVTRRLGDAYIDHKFINEQILATGAKFLDPAFTSDTDQVKALLDRGIAAQSNLALTPFVALTPEQQASLTQDIVWYEEREINGETILVPQLYLASATLDKNGTSIRGATISAGEGIQLAANEFDLYGMRINAGEDLSLTATDSIVGIGTALEGDNVTLDAGEDIVLAKQATRFGGTTSHSGTRYGTEVRHGASVNARDGKLDIDAGGQASFIGAQASASEDIDIDAQNILIDALRLSGGWSASGADGKHHTSDIVQHDGSSLSAGGNVSLNATNTARIRGSDIHANDNLEITALAGDVVIDTVQNTRSGTMRNGSKSSGDDYTLRNVGSELSTNTGDINITSTLGDIILETASIDSGNDINIEATTGAVNIEVTKDRDYHRHTSNKSNALWMSTKDEGYDHETVKHTILTGEGTLNITSAEGVTVEYRATGNLDDDIAQLSQAPGLAWMAELKDDPNVDWQGIVEVHEEWLEESEGLGPAASAIIAIAIAIATQGVGAGLVGAAEGSTLALTSNAAFSALAAQAGVSVINNKGDLGAVFNELASADTIRNIAAAALTAGLLDAVGGGQLTARPTNITSPESFVVHLKQELIGSVVKTGVSSIVTGADFSETLKANLQFAAAATFGAQFSQAIGTLIKKGEISKAQQLIAHALVGCVSASIGGADCGGAAVGAALGEAVSDLAHHGLGLDPQKAATIGRYAALASSLATADEALDVTYTNLAASNAISNNFLLPKEKLELVEKLKACDGRPWCEAKVTEVYEKISTPRDKAFLKAFDACKANSNNCAEFEAVHYDLRKELTKEGNAYFLKHGLEFRLLPENKAIYHTYVTDDNGQVINHTTQKLEGYKKYVHPIIGYEVVIDAKGKLVTDTLNAGTYNFYNPSSKYANNATSKLLGGFFSHKDFDVDTYFKFGNSIDDPTTTFQRKTRVLVLWE